jgi:hypothetical protein
MLSELSFVLPYKVMDFFDTIITDYLDPNKETEGFIEDAEEAGDFIAYFQRTWAGVMTGRNSTRRQPLFDAST